MPLWNVPLLLPLPGPPPSPLPLPAKQTADLVPKNCNKVSQAVWLRGETFPFPTPSTEEGGSPPTLLTGRGEVIRTIRGVAGIGASGQQQRSFQVHPAGARSPAGTSAHAGCGSLYCPHALSRSTSLAVQKGVFLTAWQPLLPPSPTALPTSSFLAPTDIT